MKRRIGLVLIGVVLCAMAAWLWPQQSVRSLPDGTLIELYAVTSGTNHTVNLGSKWASSVRDVLPRQLVRQIPSRISGQVVTASNSLAVWFKTDIDPSHSGKVISLGSRYECTMMDEHGKRLAVDSLNEVVAPSLHGDGRRLSYAVFPAPPNGSLTLDIQERVVNVDGTITYQSPVPAGAGLSGASLRTNGMVRFIISNRGD